MAKKIRFPLKLAEGAEVRTLEELRKHFDLQAILEYYKNGKLLTWLEDRYLEGEAEAIRTLDEAAPDFQQRICQAFRVEYTGTDVDLEAIERRQERMKRLRAFTDEAEYIENIDRVAFDQEELAELLDEDESTIYLCGEQFVVPASRKGISYVGIGDPAVHISGDTSDWSERNITFTGCEIDDPQIAAEVGTVSDLESTDILTEGSPYEIGLRYELGDGVEQDWEQAIRYYTTGVEEGDARAQYRLGRCYYNGHGVRTNLEKAYKLYTDAAKQGNLEALFALGVWSEKHGSGIYIAVDWYEQAAEQGYMEAQFALGKCFDQGGYLSPGRIEKNPALAIMWYTKAAEQGHMEAQYWLGVYYNRRQNDRNVSSQEEREKYGSMSIEWYTKAAIQGHTEAQYKLGGIYCFTIPLGLLGFTKRNTKSQGFEWYKKAAEQGHPYAQYYLGACYAGGIGTEKDIIKAIDWYRKAAKNGNKKAEDCLKALSSKR